METMSNVRRDDLLERLEAAALRYAMGHGSSELDRVAAELLQHHQEETDRAEPIDPMFWTELEPQAA